MTIKNKNSLAVLFGALSGIIAAYVSVLLIVPAPTQAGILPACTATGACQVCDIVTVFVTLGKWLMISAGGLALLVITWASFGFVTSAGNPEKITGAKKQITGAILGVGITLAAFQLVSLLIAILAVPSSNKSFAEQTSEQTGKFASLADFLGIPWWNICNVKELRKLGATKQNDPQYKGTGVCRYWGDGTPCTEVSEETEKKLIECGYLEGNADLTPEEKEKQKEKCKSTQQGILRCCKGACSDKECITEKIAQPIAQSSQVYKDQVSMLPSPGNYGMVDINSETSVRAYLTKGEVYLQGNKPACGTTCNTCQLPTNSQDCKNKCTGCANVATLPQSVLDKLIYINSKCPLGIPCVVINGGTENGHASHGRGLPVVDIDTSADSGAAVYFYNVVRALQAAGIAKAASAFSTGYTCEPNPADCSAATNWLHIEF